MPSNTVSPNMGLVVPTVGVEIGPTWASDINADLSVLDGHDHSSGRGVKVTPAGLSILSDLSFIGNNAIQLRSVRFSPQSSVISNPSDIDALSVAGVDLYYNDGLGNTIRITQSGGLAGSPGSIGSLTPPASVTYVSGNTTFVFQSDVNTSANLDAASIILRNLTASSKGLTLSPPAAMAADYTITLPSLPLVDSLVTIDSSGNEGTLPISELIPTGSAIPFTGSFVPTGYLAANGAAISRTTYAGLFSAIGTTYGVGNGTTTFNLPVGPPISFNQAGPSLPVYLHSYWHMDASTNEPNVIQPSGFDLTMVGSLATNTGKFNLARGPFSNSNYLKWPASGSSSTIYDSMPFAIDGWFNISGSPEGAIINKQSSGGWVLGMTPAGKVIFAMNGGTSCLSSASYNDGIWHYFAAIITASSLGTQNLYIDNVLVDTQASTGFTAATSDLVVGNNNAISNPFLGLIDDITYWNTVPSIVSFEAIVNTRWNSGVGSLYGSGTPISVNYIVKT